MEILIKTKFNVGDEVINRKGIKLHIDKIEISYLWYDKIYTKVSILYHMEEFNKFNGNSLIYKEEDLSIDGKFSK